MWFNDIDIEQRHPPWPRTIESVAPGAPWVGAASLSRTQTAPGEDAAAPWAPWQERRADTLDRHADGGCPAPPGRRDGAPPRPSPPLRDRRAL